MILLSSTFVVWVDNMSTAVDWKILFNSDVNTMFLFLLHRLHHTIMDILPTILNTFPIELVDVHISLHWSTKNFEQKFRDSAWGSVSQGWMSNVAIFDISIESMTAKFNSIFSINLITHILGRPPFRLLPLFINDGCCPLVCSTGMFFVDCCISSMLLHASGNLLNLLYFHTC